MLRLSNIGLLFSFLFVYTEWGEGQSAFIWELEYKVLSQKTGLLQNLMHPLILAGLIGQLALLYSAVVKQPAFTLNLLGLVLNGLVVLLYLAVALSGFNVRILVSLLPFMFFTVLFFVHHRKMKAQSKTKA